MPGVWQAWACNDGRAIVGVPGRAEMAAGGRPPQAGRPRA